VPQANSGQTKLERLPKVLAESEERFFEIGSPASGGTSVLVDHIQKNQPRLRRGPAEAPGPTDLLECGYCICSKLLAIPMGPRLPAAQLTHARISPCNFSQKNYEITRVANIQGDCPSG
jgi:hypothetical protein